MNQNWLTGKEVVRLEYPSRIKVGDFFEYKGEVVRTLTVQKDCPRIGSNKSFVAFLVTNVDGCVFPAHDVVGLKRCWRNYA